MSFQDKVESANVEKSPSALDHMHPPSPMLNDGMLKVSDIHSLYYREYGNPKGEPVIFLHGGPGSGCEETEFRFLDPETFRIILFDQRGAGKSTPHAELRENTPKFLVEDIEKIRSHLKVDKKAHIFGGSSGCTLALLYAIEHPHKVKSLTLRGVYFGDNLPQYYQGDATDLGNPKLMGSGRFFPKEWQEYVNFIPPEERGDMIKAYYKRITRDMPGLSETELDALENQAAIKWSNWLGAPMLLHPDPEASKRYQNPKIAKSIGQIGIEYLMNDYYLPENFIEKNLDKLKDIPTSIVQGRYDMICPADTACKLYETLQKHGNTECDLILSTAAHSARDPHTTEMLVKVMNERVQTKTLEKSDKSNEKAIHGRFTAKFSSESTKTISNQL